MNKKDFFAITFVIAFVYSMLTVNESYGEPCVDWGESVKIGALNGNIINEASGLAVSRTYEGRIYHINDSGGGPYFYTTNMNGGSTKKIRINGYDPANSDIEDLGFGKCYGDKTCLFIADIGDNEKERDYIEIVAVEEMKDFPAQVSPLGVLRLVYPDGPHNAEGMAVHPGGDIYILTKEENLDEAQAFPGRMYRLSADKRRKSRGETLTLEYIGELDLTDINKEAGTEYGQVATALDISADGGKFLVLTYEDAFEFDIDLSKVGSLDAVKFTKDGNYRKIRLKSLTQQEGIAYLPGDRSFIYDTEFHFLQAPIMRVDCVE